jgi:hypothetical protein
MTVACATSQAKALWLADWKLGEILANQTALFCDVGRQPSFPLVLTKLNKLSKKFDEFSQNSLVLMWWKNKKYYVGVLKFCLIITSSFFKINFDVYERVFRHLVFAYSVKFGIFLPTLGK